MYIKKGHIFNIEQWLSLSFVITMGISVWAVRTPNATVGSDLLRTILRFMVYALLLIELCFTLFFLYKNKFFINKLLFFVAICPIIYWLYIHIWAFEMESLGLSSPLITFLFALQSNNVKKNVYISFKKLIVVVSAIGIICYISYMFNLGLPYTVEPYYDGRSGQDYVNFFNISFLYINSESIRMCGIFNEPGWLGTTIALLLCYEKFDYRNISNWILFVAGILTYSLAFVVIIILGFMITNIDRIRGWMLIIMGILILMLILPSIKTSNPQINRLISRMTITSSGLVGDNRSSKTVDIILIDTLTSGRAFWGHGDGYAEYINSLKESKQILTIKTELINFGIVGTFILYVLPFFLCVVMCKGNKKALVFILCFWISLYQRPWLYIVSNYMLILATISFLTTDKMFSKFKLKVRP